MITTCRVRFYRLTGGCVDSRLELWRKCKLVCVARGYDVRSTTGGRRVS